MWLVQRVHGAFWVYRGTGVSRGAGNVQGYVVYSGVFKVIHGVQEYSWYIGEFHRARGMLSGVGCIQGYSVYVPGYSR